MPKDGRGDVPGSVVGLRCYSVPVLVQVHDAWLLVRCGNTPTTVCFKCSCASTRETPNIFRVDCKTNDCFQERSFFGCASDGKFE